MSNALKQKQAAPRSNSSPCGSKSAAATSLNSLSVGKGGCQGGFGPGSFVVFTAFPATLRRTTRSFIVDARAVSRNSIQKLREGEGEGGERKERARAHGWLAERPTFPVGPQARGTFQNTG